jgi:peptide/nickel transport system substrate-binding protein
MTANPHWWGGTVPFKRVSIKVFQDEQSEALAMRAGDIDLAFPLNGPAFGSAAGSSVKMLTAVGCGQYFLALNAHVAPFTDPHVRRAVQYAINRKDVLAAASNQGILSQTIIPIGLMRLLGTKKQVNKAMKSVPMYPFDLAKAKAELAQSAYPNGFATSVDTIAFGVYTNMAQVIAADLKTIGINLKVNVVPIGTWSAELYGATKNYAVALTGNGCLVPDASFSASYLLGTNKGVPTYGNTANYYPADLISLVHQGVEEQNQAKRLQIYTKILQKVGSAAPYVVLSTFVQYTALSDKFSWPGYGPFPWAYGAWGLYIKPA